MIDPEYYLFADLSTTDIEGPAEFYDWEAEEQAMDSLCAYESWIGYMQQLYQDMKDSAPADDFWDLLLEFEDPKELNWDA